MLLACAEPAPPPPPLAQPVPIVTEPRAIAAEVEVTWEERGSVAARARELMLAEARRHGLRTVDEVVASVQCDGRRCTAALTAMARP